MYIEQERKMMKELLSKLAGVNKCYMTPNQSSSYGYVITPGGSILYLEVAYGGFNVAFEYQRSKKTGGGCQVFDMLKTVSQYTIEEAEKQGRELAYKYGATLYKTVEQWEKGCYNFENLEKIEGGNE